jgi:hypothetical protein
MKNYLSNLTRDDLCLLTADILGFWLVLAAFVAAITLAP